jgi:hypothetical protein
MLAAEIAASPELPGRPTIGPQAEVRETGKVVNAPGWRGRPPEKR